MTDDILEKVEKIHETEQQIVLAIAGAGHSAIGWLLNVPGASRTVLEAIIPYSRESMHNLLNYTPEKSVSQQTAWDMALASYRKAKEQTKFPIGIGCTATISTVEPKRGEHRVVLATWTPKTTTTYSITLIKGARTRAEEELVVSYLILIAICQAMDVVTFGLEIKLLEGEVLTKDIVTAPKIFKEKE